MSTFGRAFAVEKITEQLLEKSPWMRDMLLRWRPAGDAVHRDMSEVHRQMHCGCREEEDSSRLRLAIRNRYLNFYRSGQSVAHVRLAGDGSLQVRTHGKYVHGDKGQGQTYVSLSSESGGYPGPATMSAWIANANKHVGEEKRFVDLIVARNPDTIDLEMALPVDASSRAERSACRMDLVALEPVGDRWRVVFWEAKLVDDPRARRKGDGALPEVVGQLAQYRSWLRDNGHRGLVARAYQDTCRSLLKFHELASRFNPGIEPMGRGIVAAAAASAPPLLVDIEPRLLIDDRTANAAFTQNGHLDKLRRASPNIHVQMVRGLDDMVLELHS